MAQWPLSGGHSKKVLEFAPVIEGEGIRTGYRRPCRAAPRRFLYVLVGRFLAVGRFASGQTAGRCLVGVAGLAIAEAEGLPVILEAARTDSAELQAQAARALRNLSCAAPNKEAIAKLGGEAVLRDLARSHVDRIAQQAERALRNLA